MVRTNTFTDVQKLTANTHVQVGLRFIELHSTSCLLQEGTSQLAHRHPSVELPAGQAGSVRSVRPAGGERRARESHLYTRSDEKILQR